MDLDRYFAHNTDIHEITKWVSENLKVEDLKDMWEGRFCDCPTNHDVTEYGYVYVIDFEDEDDKVKYPKEIVEIMEKHNLFRLVVMYCDECDRWGIDGDW